MTAGLSMADTVRVLLGDEPVGGVDKAEQMLVSIAAMTIPSIARPLPGVLELVSQLSEFLPVGVASNTPRPVLVPVLAALGITPFLTTVTAADDVPNPKPAPDLYLRACSDLGLPVSSVLVLEDSPTGVRAAQLAGCRVIQAMVDGMEDVEGVEGRLRSLDVSAIRLLGFHGDSRAAERPRAR